MAQVTSGTFTGNLTPAWVADFLSRDRLIPGGGRVDPAQFLTTDAAKAVVGVAGAAQGATSVPVAALTNPIPNGTTLDFGGAKFARLTAAAAAGATALTVTALVTALVSGDTATYPGAGLLKKVIPAGTALGRTYTERDANTGFGPAVNTDDEIYLLAFDISDAVQNPDATLVRHGTLIKENFLPGWSAMAGALQTAIRANYQTVRGID